jgi:hypothetical protein
VPTPGQSSGLSIVPHTPSSPARHWRSSTNMDIPTTPAFSCGGGASFPS